MNRNTHFTKIISILLSAALVLPLVSCGFGQKKISGGEKLQRISDKTVSAGECQSLRDIS